MIIGALIRITAHAPYWESVNCSKNASEKGKNHEHPQHKLAFHPGLFATSSHPTEPPPGLPGDIGWLPQPRGQGIPRPFPNDDMGQSH